MTQFVSLHNQTSFSILDSLISVKGLFQKAKELGYPAVGITDHGSIGAAWDAWKASKETGVKLIIGCELYFQNEINTEEKFRHIVLLAKNAIGYRNLLTLNKKGFDTNSFVGKRVYSVIDWKLLEQHSEGLICLTACGNGIISQLLMKHKMDEVESTLLKLKNIFGDNLGLEVQPNNMKRGSNIYNDEIDQFFLNRQLINLGKKHDIKVVAACNAHYLNKEEAETHDVFLAIGSHQPVHSNFRLRYPVPEFYLKTGDEVKNFFSRNYGEELAQQLCDNSLYFANLCEVPEWIDPKFSNPTGKELPIFPVKDQLDYFEFRQWVLQQPEEIQKLEEDKLYLRYSCIINFDNRVKNLLELQTLQYKSRIDEELDVLEYHGFSSYMLIVADFIRWAREHDIAVGMGRGCLHGETKVLTKDGFKKLECIEIGDKVYSHTGNLKNISKTFKFDVSNEELLKIKLQKSFGELILTKDHKIFACKKGSEKVIFKSKENKKSSYNRTLLKEPSWIKANSLECGDYIYTTFPNNLNNKYQHIFDLSNFVKYNNIIDNKIEIKNRMINELSNRSIARNIGINFNSVRNARNNCLNNSIHLNKIVDFISSKNISFENWQNLPRYKTYLVDKFINLNDEFLYMLGRWVGDGSIRHNNKNGINYAFHVDDIEGINRVRNFYENIGFNVYKNKVAKKGVALDIGTTILSDLFKSIFPDYKNNSYTKHLPSFFRKLNNDQLKILLTGLIDSDGHLRKYGESIKTTSFQLANEIKECLNLLHIPAAVYVEKANTHNKRNNATCYLISFSGVKTKLITKDIYNNGYYSKITNIENFKSDYVYDITVEDDHSYLTSSGIVHNSVGGSLIAYLLGIHQADPIKYNLIFARFHNKEKSSFPDIDIDFAPSGRVKVQEYLRKKYGEENVAHVSNVNTITPKVYVRDIARACELGGSKEEAVKIGNDVADCIPSEIHSIDDAFIKVPLFGEYAKRYPEFIKYKDICGKFRALSTHAGGIIISARPLTGLVPLRKDKDGALSIEYDKDKAEENGLVKIDTLGLSTLDIIGKTMQLIKEANKEIPKIDYNEYDKIAYDVISEGDTFGVFQLGTSGGTVDLCRRIKPQSINDISYVNSLARPSAREMRNDFIATKDGKKPFSLLHPNLGRAFNNTFGFGLYEESLMYLAQDIAGWNLHSADRLRKLTKEKGKNPKKALEWRSEFINDSIKNNIDENIATRIWDEVIELFSGYGFNNSLHNLETVDTYNSSGKFLSVKTLEMVKKGDFVKSRDENTQQEILVQITNKYDHGILPLYEIELTTGEKVKCTMDHKFRVKETREMLPLWKILKLDLSIVVNN